jgi:putative intracellular protease/amidase
MPEPTQTILFVLTSHASFGDGERATGFDYEELAAAERAFVDAGCRVRVASMRGGQPPYDPASLAEDPTARSGSLSRLLDDAAATRRLADTPALDAVDPEACSAVFLVGGHGALWDFPDSPALGALVGRLHETGRLVGAVGHGPAGLIGATRADGTALIRGVRLNARTDDEERRQYLQDKLPFLLETRLKDLGARFEKSAPFRACVVHDQGFVTGQNARSSRAVAARMLDLMAGGDSADAA